VLAKFLTTQSCQDIPHPNLKTHMGCQSSVIEHNVEHLARKLAHNSSFTSCYNLLGVLGSGTFSTVRECVSKENGQRFAVKIIKKTGLCSKQKERIYMEVYLLYTMNHPNIIKLYQFFDEKKHFYIVTELMCGGDLFHRIVQKVHFDEKTTRSLTRNLFSAIEHMHSRDIVHRDVKPENLLLCNAFDDSSIKIADFGFAREIHQGVMLNRLCGSSQYLSPEILKGENYGKTVDMWSCGVVIFTLLCGYTPFHHEHTEHVYHKIRNGAFEFDAKYWSNISAEAKDLICQLLTVEADKRITIQEAFNHPWFQTDQSITEK